MVDIGRAACRKAGIVDSQIGQLGRRRRVTSGQVLPCEPKHQVTDVLAPLDASVQRRKVINEYSRAA
jgi:hypothetical protein